jgi:AcrR family transcriptional regulator
MGRTCQDERSFFLYDERMPKVSQAYRDARREHILAAARRCFLRDGFQATSMQDLFAEAGLSSGAVYRYFASKDDMIIAIAEENLSDVVSMINTLAVREPDRSIGATLAGIFDIVSSREAADGLGGLAVLVWAEALRNPDLADRFTALLRTLRDDLEQVVRDHQQRGNLPADIPADALSALLFSIVPGYILQVALLGPESVADVGDAARRLWP